MTQMLGKIAFQDCTTEEQHSIERKQLSLFQKILLATDGTVTDLIALYTNETIKVRKLEQEIVIGGAPATLDCAVDAPILRRTVLLASAKRNYLFAESFFVFEKLSRPIQYKLLETDTPIGLMWKEEKAETFREIIDCKIEIYEKVAAYFDLPPRTPLLSRTYTVRSRQEPFGMITEKFPYTYFRQALS